MPNDDSADLFVKFRMEGGGYVPGGSTTTVSDAELFGEFLPGFFFEVDSFSFSVGIEPEANGADPSRAADAKAGLSPSAVGRALGAGGFDGKQLGALQGVLASQRGNAVAPKVQNDFKAFRSGRSNVKYPVSVQPVTIVRPIDRSSPVLLQKCIDTETFKSVSVVKRKAAGTAYAGEPYLRMDFIGVLIKDVSWSNDEPVKETTRLISRSIIIRYRPQGSDGKLYPPVVGSWSMRGPITQADMA